MELLQRYLVLAIDVGSSSVRCTAYEVTSAEGCDPFDVCAASSVPRRVVQPVTGQILVYSNEDEEQNLFDDIDQCVDEVLDQLRSRSGKVVAIGFSTLVMNLIGVDERWIPVANNATLSYACQIPSVNKEVDLLKRCVTVSL
jgi:sugar (pentulose or hexulose) kinase